MGAVWFLLAICLTSEMQRPVKLVCLCQLGRMGKQPNMPVFSLQFSPQLYQSPQVLGLLSQVRGGAWEISSSFRLFSLCLVVSKTFLLFQRPCLVVSNGFPSALLLSLPLSPPFVSPLLCLFLSLSICLSIPPSFLVAWALQMSDTRQTLTLACVIVSYVVFQMSEGH